MGKTADGDKPGGKVDEFPPALGDSAASAGTPATDPAAIPAAEREAAAPGSAGFTCTAVVYSRSGFGSRAWGVGFRGWGFGVGG